MPENTPRVTRAQLQEGIVKLALENDSFRQQLISEPKKALAASGFEPPAGVEVAVLQEDPSHLFIVLPVKATEAGAELSDDQLANVAGGVGGMTSQLGSLSGGLRAGNLGSNLQKGGNLGNLPTPGSLNGIRVSWG